MKTIESYTDAELALLAKNVVPNYELLLGGEPVNIDDEIDGLFEAVLEISEYYRRRILACLYTIMDIESRSEEIEDVGGYTPVGFNYPGKNV